MALYLGNDIIGVNNITTTSGSTTTISQLSVTSNGTYTASVNNAYSPVVVNVLPTLKYGVLRSDATLVQSYTCDRKLKEDEVIASIPSYTTTSTTLVATAALTPTVTLDQTTYNYYILGRFLTIPSYSVSSKAKGRVEYAIQSVAYEVAEVPGSNFIALLDGTTTYANRSTSVIAYGAYSRLVYWAGTSTITPQSTAAYGTVQATVAPTLSSSTLTINSPNVIIRGHTTYFTSTYFNALTDIRQQYIIEVYRAPKENLNLDGWGIGTQAMHIIDCVNNNSCKLT